ncbi:MAG: PAC2 family protein [Chloroflexi bacterium]|nr:PAC2 family protein [Chloroflexota bacterium]
MGIKLFQEPELENPALIAGWPGIGSIGLIAVDTLKTLLLAEELGEIEAWDFSYPRRVVIKNGLLADIAFPTNKFYFKKTLKRDLIFFLGEEQPNTGMGPYAEGRRAYEMANLVLDVASRFGCRRVYTSGAAVAPIHHTARSRVWAVPNRRSLMPEIARYENTVSMSDIEGRGGQGNITGLNGLLVGVAGRRGMEAMCLMGEVPIYLQGFPFPYPKASKSVLEVLSFSLGVEADLTGIARLAERNEREIETLYASFPPEVKEQLDKLKVLPTGKTEEAGPITEEDKKKILEDLDKFFKKGTRED